MKEDIFGVGEVDWWDKQDGWDVQEGKTFFSNMCTRDHVWLEFDLMFETMLWSYELLNIDRQDRDKVSQRTLIHPTNF